MSSTGRSRGPSDFSSRSHRRWFRLFLTLLTVPVILVASGNALIDPMWLFQHKNRLNSRQLAYIEREQKTNLLTYRSKPYDGLLLGNSRIVYINQNDFNGQSIFNYAASAMTADEYSGYISYMKQVTSNNIKTVYLGLSFASANKEVVKYTKEKAPSFYTGKARNPLNRLLMMLNHSILKFSWRTLRYNLSGKGKVHLIYDRYNVAAANPDDLANHDKYFAEDMKDYRKTYSEFVYNSELKSQLLELRRQNPEVQFVVFTAPVSKPMHCLLKDKELIAKYEQWLREVVDVFGELHHFEYIHSIAEDHKNNYIDANHFLPKVGTLLVRKLQGKDLGVPADFGIIITRQTLEQQLSFLRADFDKCE